MKSDTDKVITVVWNSDYPLAPFAATLWMESDLVESMDAKHATISVEKSLKNVLELIKLLARVNDVSSASSGFKIKAHGLTPAQIKSVTTRIHQNEEMKKETKVQVSIESKSSVTLEIEVKSTYFLALVMQEGNKDNKLVNERIKLFADILKIIQVTPKETKQ